MNSPKSAKLFHCFDERMKIHRFNNVGIDAQAVTANDVLLLSRRREHDDRGRPEPVIALDRSQYFEAVDLRHLEVQQDKNWISRRASGEPAAAIQIIQGLLTIVYHDDLVDEVMPGKCFQGHLHVLWAVFSQKNSLGFAHEARGCVEY